MLRSLLLLLIGASGVVLLPANAHAQEANVLEHLAAVCKAEPFAILVTEDEQENLYCDCSPEALKAAAEMLDLQAGYLKLNTTACYNGPARAFPEEYVVQAQLMHYGKAQTPLLVFLAEAYSAEGVYRAGNFHLFELTEQGKALNRTEDLLPEAHNENFLYVADMPANCQPHFELSEGGMQVVITMECPKATYEAAPRPPEDLQLGTFRFNPNTGKYQRTE